MGKIKRKTCKVTSHLTFWKPKVEKPYKQPREAANDPCRGEEREVSPLTQGGRSNRQKFVGAERKELAELSLMNEEDKCTIADMEQASDRQHLTHTQQPQDVLLPQEPPRTSPAITRICEYTTSLTTFKIIGIIQVHSLTTVDPN